MADKCPYYGGQAVLEGVMMRSRTQYATAVRRADGSVVVGRRRIRPLGERWRWARWPLVRGNFALLDSLALGMESLSFSGNIAVEDEERAQAEQNDEQSPGAPDTASDGVECETEQSSGPISGLMLWLTMIPAFAIGIGLFVLLPTWAVNWFLGGRALAVDSANFGDIFLRNLVEGGIRLVLILGYMAGIGLMPAIRRVFQYHGAEHQTINAFESGLPVTVDNAVGTSPLHPRCGTAFLLVVIVVKIIVNCFLGWPALWLRLLLRVAVLPLIAGVGYEIIYYAGRHRDSLLARALSWPGLMLQRLTTRRASADQVEVAIYALAAVAPEVALPPGLPPAPEVGIGPSGQILPDPPVEDDDVTPVGEAASE
ncbi:MAG: DUF1385 domain-containing protein [Armatimonadetes bacterium]|nr:DUF1385 domain-containing protein [Armatimonadota bacterium]